MSETKRELTREEKIEKARKLMQKIADLEDSRQYFVAELQGMLKTEMKRNKDIETLKQKLEALKLTPEELNKARASVTHHPCKCKLSMPVPGVTGTPMSEDVY